MRAGRLANQQHGCSNMHGWVGWTSCRCAYATRGQPLARFCMLHSWDKSTQRTRMSGRVSWNAWTAALRQ